MTSTHILNDIYNYINGTGSINTGERERFHRAIFEEREQPCLPPDGATADGSADPRDVSAMEVDDMTNNELDVLQSLSCSRLSVSTL